MDGAKKLAYLLEGCGAKYTRTDATEGTLFTVSTGDGQYFVLVRDDDAGIEMWSRYFTPEQAIAAMVGRSCASCPEMDNPDSYIMHLHRSLEVADRGAGTCEGSFHESVDLPSGSVPLYYCKGTNESVFVEHDARFCPMCGKKLVRL